MTSSVSSPAQTRSVSSQPSTSTAAPHQALLLGTALPSKPSFCLQPLLRTAVSLQSLSSTDQDCPTRTGQTSCTISLGTGESTLRGDHFSLVDSSILRGDHCPLGESSTLRGDHCPLGESGTLRGDHCPLGDSSTLRGDHCPLGESSTLRGDHCPLGDNRTLCGEDSKDALNFGPQVEVVTFTDNDERPFSSYENVFHQS